MLFTTSLNKAWQLQQGPLADAPAASSSNSPLPMLKAEDDCGNEQDVNSVVDSDPQQRQFFYELLRSNMRSLHSHVMAALQREVKFGEVYDSMGMMTDRITHIVHRMGQLRITQQETACLKVILLLLQGRAKLSTEGSSARSTDVDLSFTSVGARVELQYFDDSIIRNEMMVVFASSHIDVIRGSETWQIFQ